MAVDIAVTSKLPRPGTAQSSQRSAAQAHGRSGRADQPDLHTSADDHRKDPAAAPIGATCAGTRVLRLVGSGCAGRNSADEWADQPAYLCIAALKANFRFCRDEVRRDHRVSGRQGPAMRLACRLCRMTRRRGRSRVYASALMPITVRGRVAVATRTRSRLPASFMVQRSDRLRPYRMVVLPRRRFDVVIKIAMVPAVRQTTRSLEAAMHGLVAAGRTSCALLASQVPVKQSPGARDYLPLEGGAARPAAVALVPPADRA